MTGKHLATGSKQPSLHRGKLRLYSMRFCPFAQRVHLVLDSKKIPYDTVFINLHHKPDWYLEKNPQGKVPLIEHDNGQMVCESLIVADYLDEKYPQRPLHSKDPYQKAKDRMFLEQFGKVIDTMGVVLHRPDPGNMKENEEIVFQGLEIFEKELILRRTRFFGGNEPGMLDLMMWPWCERADLLPLISGNHFIIRKDRFKHLMEWKKAMQNNPAVQISMLDKEHHIKYLQSRRSGVPDYDFLS